MITIAPGACRGPLSSSAKKAGKQDIVITSHGRHVAVLTCFSDEDDYPEYRLLRGPRCQRIVEPSRRETRDGRVTDLEALDQLVANKTPTAYPDGRANALFGPTAARPGTGRFEPGAIRRGGHPRLLVP